jgi:hypothetical protein
MRGRHGRWLSATLRRIPSIECSSALASTSATSSTTICPHIWQGINVGARLEGIAEPGGICVSGKVYEEISGRFDLSFLGHGRAAAQEGWRHERQPIFLSSLAACGVAQRARSAEKHALGMTSNLLPLNCDMPAVGSACARREEGERGTSRPSFQR